MKGALRSGLKAFLTGRHVFTFLQTGLDFRWHVVALSHEARQPGAKLVLANLTGVLD